MSSITERLAAIVGPGYVSDKLADRICYTRDAGPSVGEVPGVVVRPQTTEHVSQIIRLANEVKTPIFVWGRATTFIGHGIRKGCILMALDLMNAIEKIDLVNQAVTVQTGAIWHAVDAELGKSGWELAVPGPGGLFVCSVGGTVAYNAVPHGLAEYGMTGDSVITLEVVLPDGSIVSTGSSANQVGGVAMERYANGPDLAGLFIGSCGVYGVITKVTYRIRLKPDAERFAFYSFGSVEQAANTAIALQRKHVPTHLVGLYGGPKPTGVTGEAFLHIIIRDSTVNADARLAEAHTICSALGGIRLNEEATRLYWVGHMYSWLRNTPPDAYYGDRPYSCPEATAFLPSDKVKETIDFLRNYEVEHAAEFAKHGIRIKCYDIYYSRNAAFIWIDTLYPELDSEAWKYGLKMRADYSEWLYSRFGSPGGIMEPLAQHIMPKLGAGFDLMKALKRQLDPNGILNPGVLMLGDEPNNGNGHNGSGNHE